MARDRHVAKLQGEIPQWPDSVLLGFREKLVRLLRSGRSKGPAASVRATIALIDAEMERREKARDNAG